MSAHDVALEGVRSSRFVLQTPAGRAPIALQLPGLYNVYNALAAAALASALEVPLASIVRGLETVRPAFGRAETVLVHGRELRILLVKNPAGANEVLRTLALEPGEHDLLGVLNDNIADGQDVSVGVGRRLRAAGRPRAARHLLGHARARACAAPEVRWDRACANRR